MRSIVVCDACVLYPAPLRDLLMHLAVEDLFQARWTEDIHQEWMRNVLADRPDLRPRQLHRTRELMDNHIPDCLVTGYKHLIARINLPDPNDRHVVAAAIKCNASIILTYNLKDFPAGILEGYGIVALHPDNFLSSLAELDENSVIQAIKTLRASLKKPPIDVVNYLAILKQQRLHSFVKRLEKFSNLL